MAATIEDMKRALEVSLIALQLWENWEAGLIMDNRCWKNDPDHPTIIEPHFSLLVPAIQHARNNAKAAILLMLGKEK
jgi:hypothetical protein